MFIFYIFLHHSLSYKWSNIVNILSNIQSDICNMCGKKKCNKDKISKCKEYNIFVWFLYILVGSIKIELIYFWKYLKVNESLKEVILQIV